MPSLQDLVDLIDASGVGGAGPYAYMTTALLGLLVLPFISVITCLCLQAEHSRL